MTKEQIVRKTSAKCKTQVSGEELLVLLDGRKEINVLNQTSQFLYNNCEGKTVDAVTKELYLQCVDKEELDYENVLKDCMKAFENLEKIGLISIR